MKKVSALLALLLLGAALAGPSQAAAEESAPQPREADIVMEALEQRSAFEKHFLREDGSYTAVSYAEPVHYEQDGQWREIDNTLQPVTTDGNGTVLENKDGLYDVQFAEKAQNQWITISQEDYALSWSMEASATITRQAQGHPVINFFKDLFGMAPEEPATEIIELESNAQAKASIIAPDYTDLSKNEEKTIAGKSLSRVRYDGVFTNDVHVEYTVRPGCLVEELVLDRPTDVDVWTTNLTVRNLEPVVLDSGVILWQNRDGDTVFTLAAPYMADAGGDVCEDIGVELIRISDTEYTLIKRPDMTWLNHKDRVYPVRIDPTVYADNTPESIIDTHTFSGDYNGMAQAANPLMRAGQYSELNAEYYAYIKFTNLPGIGSHCLITKAEMTLTARDQQAGYGRLNVAVPLSDWTNGFSWMTNPMHHPPIASNVAPRDTAVGMQYALDITEAAMGWYKNLSTNHGIKLYSPDPYTFLYSSNALAIASPLQRPMLKIDYLVPKTDIERGVYLIRGVNRKYLDFYADDPAPSVRTRTNALSGSDAQYWLLEPKAGGSYTIASDRNRLYTLTVSADADLAGIYFSNSGIGNEWYVYETASGCVIRHKDTRRVMDVYGVTTGPGVWNQDVFCFRYLGGDNQLWHFELYYRDMPLERYSALYQSKNTAESHYNRMIGTPIDTSHCIEFHFDYDAINNFHHSLTPIILEMEDAMESNKTFDFLDGLARIAIDEIADSIVATLPPQAQAVYRVGRIIFNTAEAYLSAYEFNTHEVHKKLDKIYKQASVMSNYMVGDKSFAKSSTITYSISLYTNAYGYYLKMKSTDGEYYYHEVPYGCYEYVRQAAVANSSNYEVYKTTLDFFDVFKEQ